MFGYLEGSNHFWRILWLIKFQRIFLFFEVFEFSFFNSFLSQLYEFRIQQIQKQMELTGENKHNDNNSRMYEDKIKLGNKIYIQDGFKTIGFGLKMFMLCWFFTAVYFFMIKEIARKEHSDEDHYHDIECGGEHMLEYIYGAFDAHETCIKEISMIR